jgi:hypothetical protein
MPNFDMPQIVDKSVPDMRPRHGVFVPEHVAQMQRDTDSIMADLANFTPEDGTDFIIADLENFDPEDDTDYIIGDWMEILQVHRRINSFGSVGMATESWAQAGVDFNGDWMPASGNTSRLPIGLNIAHDAKVFCSVDIDVLEGDRIYRTDGTFEDVVHVLRYEGHKMILLNKTKGEI